MFGFADSLALCQCIYPLIYFYLLGALSFTMTCKFSSTKTATMAVVAAVSLTTATLPAQAASPYNTGLDASGNPIADGQLDSNWLVCYDSSINGCPNPASYSAATVVNSPLPSGWMPNTAISKWISVSANPTVGTGVSGFSIKTTILGSDFVGGILSGRFSADDQISAIYLNGGFVNLLPVSTPNPSYGNWYSMPGITLASGANEIEFTIDNVLGGNYQGFRAEFNTTPTSVPTPALLPGLIGMAVAALRRKSEASEEII